MLQAVQFRMMVYAEKKHFSRFLEAFCKWFIHYQYPPAMFKEKLYIWIDGKYSSIKKQLESKWNGSNFTLFAVELAQALSSSAEVQKVPAIINNFLKQIIKICHSSKQNKSKQLINGIDKLSLRSPKHLPVASVCMVNRTAATADNKGEKRHNDIDDEPQRAVKKFKNPRKENQPTALPPSKSNNKKNSKIPAKDITPPPVFYTQAPVHQKSTRRRIFVDSENEDSENEKEVPKSQNSVDLFDPLTDSEDEKDDEGTENSEEDEDDKDVGVDDADEYDEYAFENNEINVNEENDKIFAQICDDYDDDMDFLTAAELRKRSTPPASTPRSQNSIVPSAPLPSPTPTLPDDDMAKISVQQLQNNLDLETILQEQLKANKIALSMASQDSNRSIYPLLEDFQSNAINHPIPTTPQTEQYYFPPTQESYQCDAPMTLDKKEKKFVHSVEKSETDSIDISSEGENDDSYWFYNKKVAETNMGNFNKKLYEAALGTDNFAFLPIIPFADKPDVFYNTETDHPQSAEEILHHMIDEKAHVRETKKRFKLLEYILPTEADLEYINENVGRLTKIKHTDGRPKKLRTVEINLIYMLSKALFAVAKMDKLKKFITAKRISTENFITHSYLCHVRLGIQSLCRFTSNQLSTKFNDQFHEHIMELAEAIYNLRN